MKDLQTGSLAWRGIVAAAVGGASLISSALVAHADNVANNIDASIDATAELMTLNAGGPSGSTMLLIDPTNGDGKSGCNLTGATALVVAVSSSSPGVATVSPTSVTFDSCSATPQLTVTPLSAGSTTISLSQTSNTSGGTFNLAPATFTVNVDASTPANTAPTVSVIGVTQGLSYELGSVPAPGCSVTDAEDGTPAVQPTLGPVTGPQANIGLGSQTATCSYTDSGGLTASASATYSIEDTLAPSIAFKSRTPAANAHGWNNTDVTVTWSCDAAGGSAVLAETVAATVTNEGANQSATGTCMDLAGNSASATVDGISIDKTAPVVTGSRSPEANANGWNNTDVTVTWSCDGGLSGVDSVTEPVTLSTEGANQSATGTCTDDAGNSASATVDGIGIDKTGPSITWNGGPVTDGDYYFGSVPAAPTCSATDLLSGVDGECSVDGYDDTVGTHTMTAVAADRAGNETTVRRTYTVLAWTLRGFYQPVDMSGVLNTVKGGSTVPFKFEVLAGSTELIDPSIASFTVKGVTCPGTTAPTDEIEFTTTGGTSLRYDSTAGQFIQNWQTPKKPGSCFQVTMTTKDGRTSAPASSSSRPGARWRVRALVDSFSPRPGGATGRRRAART